MKNNEKNFDYKWIIVLLSFIMVMICLGFCSSPRSLYIAPVTKALGIKRSAFSVNDSLRFLSSAVMSVFFGSLISKFGAKKLITFGFASLVLSNIFYSVASNVYTVYLGGILLGVGLSFTTTTMVGSIVNTWCKENKGTIMGIVLAANGIGGAVAIQIISPIIESGEFGYRNAYRLVALVLFIIGLIMFVFFKNKPDKTSLSTKNNNKSKTTQDKWQGLSYSEAIKRPYFYAASLCIFFTGLVLMGVNGVSAAHMKDMGLSPSFVSSVLSINSIALAAFKFLTGFIYDKKGLRVTITICSVTAVIVMISLSLVTNTISGMIFAAIYSVFSALALPLETIMLPIYASDLFGEKSFNKILGIFVSLNTAGYAVGAPVINLCYDMFGNYAPGFLLFSAIMCVIIILLQFVITYAHKERDKSLNQ